MSEANQPKTETLAGRIERITFANEENGYTVMSVRVPGRRNPVTAVGNLASPRPGEFIEMEGSFVNNPSYGPQFKVVRHTLSPPTTEAALQKYLGSGLVKGVGPVLAGRLVDHFGERTLDILDSAPERLVEVKGLGAHRREMIIDSWKRASGLKRLLQFLAEFGLGPSAAMRIMRKLGPEADRIIREDPYILAYEVSGIGFITADKVARTLGFSSGAPQRLEAGLLYALNQAADEGHVCRGEYRLLKEAAELMPEAEAQLLQAALGRLILDGRLKSQPQLEPGEVDVYLPRLYRAENWVASDLLRILHTPPAREVPRPQQALKWACQSLNLELSPSQEAAVLQALECKVLVLTGGPGTGKTTITRVITAIFGAMRSSLALVAPTGRAAKRLSEATGLPAKTVHRLLEYSPQAGGFLKGPNNKLDVELMLVDEASMVDLALMNQLTGALPHQARLILVGDQDQLPSVGPGRVLADLIESGAVAVARLKEVHRQAESSQIVKAAYQVNQGLFPESSHDRDNGDFYFIEENNPQKVLEKIIYLVTEKLPAKLKVDPAKDIQLLTPMHSRDLGTEHLNQVFSERLNPEGGPPLIRFGHRFKRGDRVMQLKNNYNREVFNGDQGQVTRIDQEAQELAVDFDGREVLYDFADLEELVLAYAITIHKSQGSEFPVVVMPLTTSHHIMLRRKLLYTAITRGRRFVVIVGSGEAVRRAVANDAEQARTSRLALKLAGLIKL